MSNLYSRVNLNFSRLFKSVRDSELLLNTSILISGTTLAQLIPILLQPVLRRLYLPETFGAYSVYLSLIGIISIISSFKYDLAIVLPKKIKLAANVLFLSIIFNILVCAVFLAVIIIWQNDILIFLNLSPKFTIFLFVVPIGVFLYSSYQCLNNWLIREKGFLPLTLNKFVRRGSEGVSQATLGIVNASGGLLYGDIIGHISNIVSGIVQVKKRNLSLKLFSRQKLRYVAEKYSDFPKYNLLPSLMSACSFLLPPLFINKFYSAEVLGYFDLSRQLLLIPLALISASISNVLLQKLSENYRERKSVRNDLVLVAGITLSVAFAEILIISIFGVDLFRFIFGNSYEISGEISRILVWSYALSFLVGSFSSVFIALNRIKLLSIWQVIYFGSILSLIFFRHLGHMSFLRIYVVIELVCYVIIILLMIFIVTGYEKRLRTETVRGI